MNKKNLTINFGGGGMFLTTLFFIAKVTNYINWDWKWVFAPLWLPAAIFFGILAAVGLGILFFAVISATLEHHTRKKRFK